MPHEAAQPGRRAESRRGRACSASAPAATSARVQRALRPTSDHLEVRASARSTPCA